MRRVITYVDGFNLYFGLRSKGWRRYYWLDLRALSETFLQSRQTLEHCHYFTARVRSNAGGAQDARRQSIYLDALATRPDLTIHYGHYLSKDRSCRRCGHRWTDFEEKMTDVNIAAQLLSDAYDDRLDTAIIISGDSDLTTPVRMVRARFPSKRVLVAFPPARRSHELAAAAHASFIIGKNRLRRCQLPDLVVTSSGHSLHRPAQWR